MIEKKQPFQQIVLGQLDIYMDTYITPNTNINSKLVTDPSVTAKIFLEENGVNLHDLGLGFHQKLKASNDNIKKVKRQLTE